MKLNGRSFVWGFVAAAYVGGLIAYVVGWILPDVRVLKEDTRAVLEFRADADRRVDDLGTMLRTLRKVTTDRPEEALLPADSAQQLRDGILPFFSAAGQSPEAGYGAQYAEVGLDASTHEVRVAGSALMAVTLLERGQIAAARVEFEAAIDVYTDVVHAWAGAREADADQLRAIEAALEGVLARGARGLGLWALVGLILAGAWFVVVGRRRREPVESGDDGLIARYGRVLEEAATALVVIDSERMVVAATNERARSDLGLTEDEVVGRPVDQLWRTRDGAAARVLREVGGGVTARSGFFADQVAADGSTHRVEVTAFQAGTGASPEVVTVVHDLRERRRLEQFNERLAHFAVEHGRTVQKGDLGVLCREVTEMAAELLDVQCAGVWFMEADGIRAADIFDAAKGEHTSDDFIAVEEAPDYFRALRTQRTISASNVKTHPATHELTSYLESSGVDALLDVPIRRGAEVIGVLCHEWHHGPRVWTAEEQVVAGAIGDLVLQAVESAEREETEARLAASELRYRSIFESASVGISESTRDGYLRRANATFCRMLGYTADELRELTFEEITHPDDLEASSKAIQQFLNNERSSFVIDKRYIRKDGSILYAEVQASAMRDDDGELSSFVVVVQDRTEEKLLGEQLAHAQRMESIGQLAGGIAHDFNNVLTTVLGNAELARARLSKESPESKQLAQIEDSARRARGLTQQLLTFARRDVVRPSVLPVDRLAKGADELIRRLIGEDVEFVTDLSASDGLIQIDPQQFDQVVLNLSVNARDAGSTRIEMRTDVVPASAVPEAESLDVPASEFVVLEVTDNGRGMTEAIQSRVFEPFFTTKEPGEGTGLGLATCYGIVREAGGVVRVRSAPGEGSTFTVLLPRRVGEADTLPSPVDLEVHASEGQTVLVMEDAEPVRMLIVDSLERVGYRVIEAATGAEGVDAAASHIGRIDLCVSDIVMPGQSGPKAVEVIRKKRPGMPVLFISGYSADTAREDALDAPNTELLLKPFTPTELLSKVWAMLETDERSAAPINTA